MVNISAQRLFVRASCIWFTWPSTYLGSQLRLWSAGGLKLTQSLPPFTNHDDGPQMSTLQILQNPPEQRIQAGFSFHASIYRSTVCRTWNFSPGQFTFSFFMTQRGRARSPESRAWGHIRNNIQYSRHWWSSALSEGTPFPRVIKI